jgi:hypothetical protein
MQQFLLLDQTNAWHAEPEKLHTELTNIKYALSTLQTFLSIRVAYTRFFEIFEGKKQKEHQRELITVTTLCEGYHCNLSIHHSVTSVKPKQQLKQLELT